MLDFVAVSTKTVKKDVVEISPRFMITKTEDLMIRGGDFYAIWVEDEGKWSTDEHDAIKLIDRELDIFYRKNKHLFEGCTVRRLYLRESDSGQIDKWHRYCQKQMRDSYTMLDGKIIFANDKTNKKDYSSKRLSYSLAPGSIDAYDRLISVLYSPEERMKIEWAIGAIVTGDSRKIQKFEVLYGSGGTGKSTILNIIEKLFDGYCATFDAKALGSTSNAFALEPFQENPLVAIQHDGDLSKIEDNTRLNSLVSHEKMVVNEKFKSTYTNLFKCFIFMGTNKPVRITDAKSGLIRRLIDVSPTGNLVPEKEYFKLLGQIDFELGAIAYHCMEVYENNKNIYDSYIPTLMLGASNSFYNFVEDAYSVFKREEYITLSIAWEMYKLYIADANIPYPLSKMVFKEELKNYFEEYHDRYKTKDGDRVRSCYVGFDFKQFSNDNESKNEPLKVKSWIILKSQQSKLDDICKNDLAQLANEHGTPSKKWDNTKTKLSSIDTSQLHWLKIGNTKHVVVDFDKKDENGNKSLKLNIEAAEKWPPTYTEVSKGGEGLHLHYFYTGDNIDDLSPIYDEDIEVKIFTKNRSLRRRLSTCNDLDIATISSGLPLKEGGKMLDTSIMLNEKAIRTIIKKSIDKKYHGATKPNIDLIHSILEKAYNSGVQYDVRDMRNSVLVFAAGSTNNADYCISRVSTMKFESDIISDNIDFSEETPIVFFDVEVFPNLFLVNWKLQGEGQPMTRLVNPSIADVSQMMKYKLVGFNNRRYDNHILYAAAMGYTNEQLYNLSQKIINDGTGMFSGAYNISYTDVYDFASDKKSLKKFEVELGIYHKELGLPWDKPVPEKLWNKVSEYCDNDVHATEAVFNYLKSDWTARQILADLAGMTVNDTTNSLTTRIIFGNEKNTSSELNYRHLGEGAVKHIKTDLDVDEEFSWEDLKGRPVFKGYKYEYGKSLYRETDPKEGGYVFSKPGMYYNIALLDIASMHPTSTVEENLFGKYTKNYKDLLDARLAIKHGDISKLKTLLNGKLMKYVDGGSANLNDLSKALKIPINSVYGLTSAKFDNAFRDKRNKDNIVAKRGALFMINLLFEVQRKGYEVVHIKTDSIKIANADNDIIQFVYDYGKLYGYTFEHEATYSKMCLVNKSTYIAKYATLEHCEELYGKQYCHSEKDIVKDNKKKPNKWVAVGEQFAVPYVFKTLFSKEPIIFEDYCEIKSVTSAMYIGTGPEDSINYKFIGKIGNFVPVKKEYGGVLYRGKEQEDGTIKYSSVTGTKGYHFEEVPRLDLQEIKDDLYPKIDKSYHKKLVEDAIEDISKYGDFDTFVA